MTERMRSCTKMGCRWPAAATLAFRYATREVWLSDLGEDHPSTYDLCPHHADVLAVPRGWGLVDQRTVGEVVREPSADEIAERASRLRSAVERQQVLALVGRRSSRYDRLVQELPRIAAEVRQEGADLPPPERTTGPEGGGERAAGVPPPARDLAPMALEHPVGPATTDGPDVPLPFDEAVVVRIDRSRRRPSPDDDGPVNA